MTKIVNLRQARKDRARAEKRAAGDANSVKFGEAKAQKNLRKAETERATRALEAHRTEDE